MEATNKAFQHTMYKNVSPIQNNLFIQELENAYITEAGGIKRWPGLSEVADTMSIYPIDGIYNWENKEVIIIVSGGNVYSIDYNFSVTSLAGDVLSVGSKVSFVNTGSILLMANGGRMVYTDGVNAAAYIPDKDAPVEVSSVAFLNQYVVAMLEESNQFYHSNAGDYSSWQSTSIFSAEGEADHIKKIAAFNGLLYVFGTKTIEVFYASGNPVFSRRSSPFSMGCISGESVAVYQGSAFFLSNDGRVIMFTGESIKPISTPVESTISEFTQPELARGTICNFAGRIYYILKSQVDGITISYDIVHNKWCHLSSWNEEGGETIDYGINDFVFIPQLNITIGGSTTEGKIFKLDPDVYTNKGKISRVRMLTGHLDYGVMKQKQASKVFLRAKTGVGITGDTKNDVALMLRYRKNDSPTWSYNIPVTLGSAGENDISRSLFIRRRFETIQWELSFTDNADLEIARFEEHKLEIIK